jgi:hypothetical protein
MGFIGVTKILNHTLTAKHTTKTINANAGRAIPEMKIRICA